MKRRTATTLPSGWRRRTGTSPRASSRAGHMTAARAGRPMDSGWLSPAPSRKTAKTEPPQLCLLPLSGGDAFVFTDLPKGARRSEMVARRQIHRLQSKRESRRSREASAEEKEGGRSRRRLPTRIELARGRRLKKKKPGSATDEERESDVHVITRAVYREDDEGYLDPKRPQHLWIVSVPEERVTRKLSRASSPAGGSPKATPFGRRTAPKSTSSRGTSTNRITNLPKSRALRCSSERRRRQTSYDHSDGHSHHGAQPGRKTRGVYRFSSGTSQLLHATRSLDDRSHFQAQKAINLTSGFDFDAGDSVFGDNAAPRGPGGNRADLVSRREKSSSISTRKKAAPSSLRLTRSMALSPISPMAITR